ncbi:MAG: 50S ribosomal protein L9 [Alphaproteobacteria bacterium]|nr:50S ribosomal protein L9 [Alphaproteobacteria bacterium]
MEVILLERIERLGQMGDVVRVKPGFARNYLIPQKKALRATKENLEGFEHRRAELEAANESQRDAAQSTAGALEGLSLVVIRSAGETGQLYGSVTSRDIAEALSERGHAVERRQIELAHPIKSLGLHAARIRLHPEVAVDIELNVAQSEDEAAAQATSAAAATAPGAEEEAKPAAEAVVEAAEEVAETAITEEVAEEFFEEPAAVTAGESESEEAEQTDQDQSPKSDD